MTKQNDKQRREFIRNAFSACVFLSCPLVSAIAKSGVKLGIVPPPLSGIKATRDKKVVWIMLRGAMDSLHAVIPTFDEDYYTYRGSSMSHLKNNLLPLDDGFALHPAFKHLHSLYKKKQFSPVVAVASGYRERSHFDAQDQMESGLNEIDHENGWLARALGQYQGQGLAIGRTIPIALRSEKGDTSNTWYPSTFKPADDDLLDRLAQLYDSDDELSKLLQQAVEQRDNPNMMSEGKTRPKFDLLAKRCGEILKSDTNIKCAMLELGGWDTHNNQTGRLQRQFSLLDEGIKSLQEGLGEAWDNTIVFVTTEFGRTVALNGTSGTDHGTASCMFMLGGGLQNDSLGGAVLGQWPGLKAELLYESRDLMPTSDVRAWIAKGLQQHWGLDQNNTKAIFPDISTTDIAFSHKSIVGAHFKRA